MRLKVKVEVGMALWLMMGALVMAGRMNDPGEAELRKALLAELFQAVKALRDQLPDKVGLSILLKPSEVLRLVRIGGALSAFLDDLKAIQAKDWGKPWPLR